MHAAEPGGLCTPLLLAASKGHAEVVRVLLDSGARVADLDCNDQTPLHRAAGAGRGAVVKLLLAETGVKVNAPDKEGNTPLHLAMYEQHEGPVRALLDAGGSTKSKNNKGETPLSLAQDSFCEVVLT